MKSYKLKNIKGEYYRLGKRNGFSKTPTLLNDHKGDLFGSHFEIMQALRLAEKPIKKEHLIVEEYTMQLADTMTLIEFMEQANDK